MNDRTTKKMTPTERQQYHATHSAPIMEKIKTYSNDLITNKLVEPNCSLGKAIAYLNNHWKGLTLFLSNGEAPLSNNDCERSIKPCVLIRKNSYFYKTSWGSMVGDVLLSIINTCRLNDINPYEYLIEIQANAEKAKANPADWLPWNYKQNEASLHAHGHCCPRETLYQQPLKTDPITTPLPPDPEKKTLRERCRDFSRRFYQNKEQACTSC
jgi:hypothetical protein